MRKGRKQNRFCGTTFTMKLYGVIENILCLRHFFLQYFWLKKNNPKSLIYFIANHKFILTIFQCPKFQVRTEFTINFHFLNQSGKLIIIPTKKILKIKLIVPTIKAHAKGVVSLLKLRHVVRSRKREED